MLKTRTTYQHGHLPEALAGAVLALVRERGVRGFTLAEAARRSGVSGSAPYRHYADRDALLAAVATQIYAEFGASITGAKRRHRAPLLQAQAMARAYVNFAISDAAKFQILFNSGLTKHAYPDLERAADEATSEFVETVARLCANAPREAPALALSLRACVHGYAMLLIDGSIAHAGFDPRDVPDLAARAVLRLAQAAS